MCGGVQQYAVVRSGAWWCAVVCSGVQWCAVVCSDVQLCAVVCSGVQWCTVVCSGVEVVFSGGDGAVRCGHAVVWSVALVEAVVRLSGDRVVVVWCV